MIIQCACCPKRGQIGNGIRYTKVIENGKVISIPLCTTCEVKIETEQRPK